MKFSRVKESLSVLESAKEVTVYDALNVFYDLCEDIRQETGTIDKLPAGSEAKMVQRMCWAGRTLLKIAKEHPDYMQKSEKSQNWEKTYADILQEDQRMQQYFTQLSEKLEECKKACEEKKYREDALNLQLEKLQSERDTVGAAIAEKENAYVALNQDFEAQKGLYNQLISRMQKLDGEHKKLLADTNALDEKLKIVNVEELREIYNRKSEELEMLQKNYADLETQIKSQSEEEEKLKAEIEQRSKFLQEKAWSVEAEKQKAQADVDALQERIARAIQDKVNLTDSLSMRERELKELESWFNSLEAQEYFERLQKCNQRVAVLKASQDKLTKELKILGAIANENAGSNLRAYQQYFRDAMEYIEQTLNEYQKNYLIVTEVFGQGGSSL